MRASTQQSNRLRRSLQPIERLPRLLREPVRTWVIGRAIPLVGTARIAVETLEAECVELRLANRRRVRNHIGGVHAAAMALLAETATGLMVAMHLPDDRLPLLKSMRVDYRRRAEGALRARSTLAATDIERLGSEERGSLAVPVQIVDETDGAPLECEMHWAWVPRRSR